MNGIIRVGAVISQAAPDVMVVSKHYEKGMLGLINNTHTHGLARRGGAGLGEARRGMARPGLAWLGAARQGMALRYARRI